MTRALSGFLLATALTAPAYVVAQEAVWLQLETHSSVGSATTTARNYATRLENVTGFSLGGGYYAIALGPYAPGDAAALLRQLQSRGAVPPDAYVAQPDIYGQQFFPVGEGAPIDPQPLPGETEAETVAPDPVLTPEDIAAAANAAIEGALAPTAPPVRPQREPTVAGEIEQTELAPAADPVPEAEPEETRDEALASENALDRDQKRDLQVALQWAGFYNSAIDGLFGGGTRGSMSAWQESKGYEPTGILTTRQRAELLNDYNAVLDGMDLALVRDASSGIEMLLPTGVVEFTEYEPPFVKFDAKDPALDARVYFISQPGDEDRFFGLYEILQTLEVVPEEGERSRSSTQFEIDAMNNSVHTYVYATRADGAIKGWMMIWPAGDEERRSRVLAEMKPSFTRLNGVLDPAIAPPGEDQAVNLIAGLEVRQPQFSHSGFYIDNAGSVLTSSDILTECSEVTIDGDFPARVIHADADLGIAVLGTEGVAPVRIAEFQTSVPRLRDEVSVAGYPFGGLLGAPAMTFGTLEDLRGLSGEEDIKRLALAAGTGDAGGPVFDSSGAVLGVLLPDPTTGPVLPDGVSFAADSDAVIASLQSAGLSVATTTARGPISRELLTRHAAEMTVLVSCW